MCQVCTNSGNIAEEVKIEVIFRRGFVISFSRYISLPYLTKTCACTKYMHSITCYTLYIIIEQDILKVRSCMLFLSLPEKVIKGTLSQEFCCFQLHSLLKSLPGTSTRYQNAQMDYIVKETYQMNGGSESKP